MKVFLITSAILLTTGCAQSQLQKKETHKPTTESTYKIPEGNPVKPKTTESVAYFAEGCFWHTEIVFQSLEGVRDVVSGYSGGKTNKPGYEEVGTGTTGHAETVAIYYDPSKISFETLTKAFFASHDPTQLNRQGNDVGTQYRGIAFYSNDAEKKIIEAELKKLSDSKKYPGKIVTEVKQFSKFWPAEDYHQEYIIHHPENRYVQLVSIPDYLKFRKEFKEGKFKAGL
jgi:peptide-methionine (S)-S-oxide reductase